MSKGMKKIGIYPTSKINYSVLSQFLCAIYISSSQRLKSSFLFTKLQKLSKHCLTLLLLIASLQNLTAQTLDFVRQNEVPVEVNGQTLQYPWLGGFNNPQFSEADLNNDGILDLFVFDRASNTVMTFVHTGSGGKNGYEYVPKLAENFPELENWALLVDYNCDGIVDLFSSNQNGISVYKGDFEDNSKIGFEFVVDKLKHDAVVEIFVSEFDIPAIVDVNNDGDMDILTFNIAGGFIEYFENYSVESNFACGDLSDYQMFDRCWGNFYESGFEAELTLDTCSSGKKKKWTVEELRKNGIHPGSTLLAMDMDGDGDKEIMLGDIASNNIVMALNGGTPAEANMVSQDTIFPSNSTPVNMKAFPAAFSIDVNKDGAKDLLVSPNAAAQSNHFECVWYYENTGTDDAPNFNFRTDTLMVENMIDVAAYSHPAFFDHNGDGLLDLVIGNEGYEVRVDEFSSYLKPTLALYENVGTTHEPAFKLVSRDYMEIGTQLFTTQFDPTVESAKAYHPTFGDLDNDGDKDMLIGDDMGYIHYFDNQPTADGTAKFVKKVERMPDNTGSALDVKQLATPQLVDVNEDGLLDMIAGNHDGRVYYYQNIGTLESPIFRLENNQWGAVQMRIPIKGNKGHAVPNLFKLEDGRFRLLVSNDIGDLFLFEDIEDNIDGGPFTIVSEQLIPSLEVLEGSPTTADVDNDGRLDLLMGGLRGGVLWYETETVVGIEDNLSAKNKVSFYPNPAQNMLYFDFKNASISSFNVPVEVRIYNTLGQLVLTSMVEREQNEVSIEGLNSGLYFVELKVEGEWIGGEKLIIEK